MKSVKKQMFSKTFNQAFDRLFDQTEGQASDRVKDIVYSSTWREVDAQIIYQVRYLAYDQIKENLNEIS